jgi:hypothetical protein
VRSSWVSVRPFWNSLHHFLTWRTVITSSPYSFIGWRRIWMSETRFGHKNRFTYKLLRRTQFTCRYNHIKLLRRTQFTCRYNHIKLRRTQFTCRYNHIQTSPDPVHMSLQSHKTSPDPVHMSLQSHQLILRTARLTDLRHLLLVSATTSAASYRKVKCAAVVARYLAVCSSQTA